MNLQRLLHGKSLLLPDTACILVFKVISIHYIRKLSSSKGMPSNLGAQWIHRWWFYFFSLISDHCLQGWDQVSACIYIFFHLITAEKQQGFSHTLIKQVILLASHTLSLSPLAFKGRGVHQHGLQPEFWSSFEPVTCTLCLLICERLLVTPSSQDRLPPCPKGITSPQKIKTLWGKSLLLRHS